MVGNRLRQANHDVLALDERQDFNGLSDENVLRLAAQEGRVLVTFDAHDFVPILRRWSGELRLHAGCIIVVGITHHQFGLILTKLSAAFVAYPAQEYWTDRALFVSRAN
ncbi:MAG: DUF5615 family PIN-like protein [Chloroflexota bacterium]|nr:DUF5615 family PIN-like protein [Chloroflexota bacterium]